MSQRVCGRVCVRRVSQLQYLHMLIVQLTQYHSVSLLCVYAFVLQNQPFQQRDVFHQLHRRPSSIVRRPSSLPTRFQDNSACPWVGSFSKINHEYSVWFCRSFWRLAVDLHLYLLLRWHLRWNFNIVVIIVTWLWHWPTTRYLGFLRYSHIMIYNFFLLCMLKWYASMTCQTAQRQAIRCLTARQQMSQRLKL